MHDLHSAELVPSSDDANPLPLNRMVLRRSMDRGARHLLRGPVPPVLAYYTLADILSSVLGLHPRQGDPDTVAALEPVESGEMEVELVPPLLGMGLSPSRPPRRGVSFPPITGHQKLRCRSSCTGDILCAPSGTRVALALPGSPRITSRLGWSLSVVHSVSCSELSASRRIDWISCAYVYRP